MGRCSYLLFLAFVLAFLSDTHAHGAVVPGGRQASYSRVETVSESGYTVSYVIKSYRFVAPDGTEKELTAGDFTALDDGVAPVVQTIGDLFSIPMGYDARLVIKDVKYASVPVSPETIDRAERELPSAPVSLVRQHVYRGRRVAQVGVYPIKVNYDGSVSACTELTFEVRFVQSPGNVMLRNSATDFSCPGMYQDFNADELFPNLNPRDTIVTQPIMSSSKADAGYLILSLPFLKYSIDRFAEWKRMLGFNVEVVYDNGWTPEKIKSTVQSRYDRDKSLMYLLLVGSHEDLPAMTVPNAFYYYTKKEDEELVGQMDSLLITDMYYGCMDGDDDTMPDLYRGRWATSNADEIEAIVDKIIFYEQTPTTDSVFYKTGVHCSYFEFYSNPFDYLHHAGMENLRFMETSEDVRDYMISSPLDKTVNRVYWVDEESNTKGWTPYMWNYQNYSFYREIPEETIQEMWINKDKNESKDFSHLYDEIDDGRFYVLYRGHGKQTELDSKNGKKPNFGIKNAMRLRNNEWTPLFLSICCQTGNFASDCFAQSLVSNESGGAIAAFAATHDGIAGYDDVLTCGIFNAVWPSPGFKPPMQRLDAIGFTNDKPVSRLGQMLDKSLNMTEVKYDDGRNLGLYTKEIFHCFGDPSMMFTTEVPSGFDDVEIINTLGGITVASGDSESYIAFYDHSTGEVSRYFGSRANYSTQHAESVSVTVSGHNKIPFIRPAVGYNTNGTSKDPRANQILGCSDLGGVLQVDYKTIPDAVNPHILAVDLFNNWIVADEPCIPGEGSIGLHLTGGMFAITLYGSNIPMHTVRVIVPHFPR